VRRPAGRESRSRADPVVSGLGSTLHRARPILPWMPSPASALAPAPTVCDLAVVGGGILGLAVARELQLRQPRRSVVVLEAEDRIAAHQSGRNSGVVHQGVYYKPGSLKAELCRAGAAALLDYLDRREIPCLRCGKVIVATEPAELPGLEELERRARANGVDLLRVGPSGLRDLEPHASGIAALHVPATSVVDFAQVAAAYADDLVAAGGTVGLGCAVTAVSRGPRRLLLEHTRGTLLARGAVFCGGLQADRLAVLAGAPESPRIVPFRGSYLRVRPARACLVRGLIYPVPDPRLPFLGVHLTRHVDGEVTIGPAALLEPRLRSAAWPGTWRMARQWWRTGVTEVRRALSTGTFAAAAARLVPELAADDLEPGPWGLRAQAVERDGTLVDDFVFSRTEHALHVRNAPSPGATASLAIAARVADQAESHLDLAPGRSVLT
jgi:(S)-2-hydroxyglutarate dehydrogenase